MSAVTHAEFLDVLRKRFGDNPADWAFVCPQCKDVATGQDFKDALAEHPRERRDGTKVIASDVLGQECIGRTLGALKRQREPYRGRGCDWCAYGLFRGPLMVEVEGRTVPSFHIAPSREGVTR